MAKIPDPSYWGNPPETPRSKYDQRVAPPYQQSYAPQQPVPASQQPGPTAQQPGPAAQQPVPQYGSPQTGAAPQTSPVSQPVPLAQSDRQPETAAPSSPTPAASPSEQPSPAQQTPEPNTPGSGATYNEPHTTEQSANTSPGSAQPYQQNAQAPYPYAPQPGPYPSNLNPAEPPHQQQSSKRPLIIGIVIVIVLIGILGIAGCTACTALFAANPSYSTYDQETNTTDPYTDDDYGSEAYDETAELNYLMRSSFGLASGVDDEDEAAFSDTELNEIQKTVFHNASKSADEDGEYEPGVYYVGSDIPAGSYWFDGDDEDLSDFYILQPSTTTNGAYDVMHINSYYGHNIMELKDNEVLVLANEDGMTPLDKAHETFSDPYSSGVYRVGVDIPAGTYYLVSGPVEDFSAYYIMKDLNYSDSSYLDLDYPISDDDMFTVTLEEGTYIELYNMVMSSDSNKLVAGSSTKT